MQKSTPQPRSSKTPSGGRKMAKITLQISEQVSGIAESGILCTKALHIYTMIFIKVFEYRFLISN